VSACPYPDIRPGDGLGGEDHYIACFFSAAGSGGSLAGERGAEQAAEQGRIGPPDAAGRDATVRLRMAGGGAGALSADQEKPGECAGIQGT